MEHQPQPQLLQQQQQQQHPQHPHSPSPHKAMSVGDMRQQIIANALHLYPNVVNQHVKRFPNIPVRAGDIFDIFVRTETEQSTGTTSSYARLTHAHDMVPAARMTLLGGPTGTTVESALQALLDVTCAALFSTWDGEYARPDLQRHETGPLAGMEYRDLTNFTAISVAGDVLRRAKAINAENSRHSGPTVPYERDA